MFEVSAGSLREDIPPRRIGILGHGLGGAGAVSVGRNLIGALGRVAPQHEYCLTIPARRGFEAVCEAVPRCRTVRVEPKGLLGRWWFETSVLRDVVGEWRPDALLGLADRGLVRPPCPQAILVHRPALFYPPKHYGRYTPVEKLLTRYHRHHLSRSLRATRLLICQTPVAERRLRQTYGYTGRVAVVPNAVSRFVAAPEADRPAPDPLLPFADRMILFCLTRYYGHKNLEILVDLFRQHSEELADVMVVLTIARDQHPRASELLDRIAREGVADHVRTVGALDQAELAAYYEHSNALLLPTLLESFSGTYLEAMHFGLPILTSDLDFAHAVCGDAALYFDPWDPASIKDAILKLKGDPELAAELVRRGRERLEGAFKSWDEVAAQVADLLEEIAE